MWPDPQETADLVTFTEKILNRKLHFLCSVSSTVFMILPKEMKTIRHSSMFLLTGIPQNSSSMIRQKGHMTKCWLQEQKAGQIFQKTALECLIDAPSPVRNFSIFFHLGHSYSNPLPINYWEHFPIQTNLMKQYTYSDFFVYRNEHIVFSFVRCIKKSTYCQFLNSFRISNRMFVDVILMNVFLNIIL